MKAVGIIAEYNPLHNGHVYHIKEAKKIAGSDVVVVAMSGDYVQRGEPAILDKWERARLAIENGVDIVMEIPVYYCLGNAKQYGAAGVFLLESLGNVTHLAFGSETGNINKLRRIANNLRKNASDIEREIKLFSKEGLSYPKARAAAYAKVCAYNNAEYTPEDISMDVSILEGSNDILALEYIMACDEIEPIAITRIGAGYHDSVDEIRLFQSATGIRKIVKEGKDIESYVPANTVSVLNNSISTYPDKWLDLLKFCVLTASADKIDRCPSGGEGIGNRMKAVIADATTWDGFVRAVKSKRYTYTRISRLCMQLILDIDRKKYERCIPAYIRILGLSDKGRDMLSEVKKNKKNKLPVITNINKEFEEVGVVGNLLVNLDVHAADIYNLTTGRDISANSDHRVTPIIR